MFRDVYSAAVSRESVFWQSVVKLRCEDPISSERRNECCEVGLVEGQAKDVVEQRRC